MGTGGKELTQSFSRERNRVRPSHADRVKTLRPRGLAQPGFQRRRIQKSRLA
jgi:hypothetical protein